MTSNQLRSHLNVIDSHTAGEPTRCIISGGPDLGSGPLQERLERLRRDHDPFRRAVLCEPRGSDVLVGALLVEPFARKSAAGVIFFNNAGYLGMCGHGMIGVAATLAFQGRIKPGEHEIDTPVGIVNVHLQSATTATIRNIPSYRYQSGIELHVPGFGMVRGDVAWGGNWFFLVREHTYEIAHDLTLKHVEPLTSFTWEIRRSLIAAGVTGADGAEIDHIELFTDPIDVNNNSRNFVLCPGKAYDRSPCGTGTSAKMACLAADGILEPGQSWRQEGILGTVFEGHFEFEITAAAGRSNSRVGEGPRILPAITGSAYVTAESTLIFDLADPFRMGVPA